MGKIFCIIGKSSTGKDTIYQELLKEKSMHLQRIVPYTTRPIRENEIDGETYHFVSIEEMEQLQKQDKIIECRAYHTVHGIWYYFTAKDHQIEKEDQDYLMIGTLESCLKLKKYFGSEKIVPIYIELEDGERLTRALHREKQQAHPKYEEMCRRFLADGQDFTEEKLQQAGITKRFQNNCLEDCLKEVCTYIAKMQK